MNAGGEPLENEVLIFTSDIGHEGAKGFYKGLLPAMLRVTPACCITFVVYENLITYLLHSDRNNGGNGNNGRNGTNGGNGNSGANTENKNKGKGQGGKEGTEKS